MQQYLVFSNDTLSISFQPSAVVEKTRGDDDEVKADIITEEAKAPSINNDALVPLQAVYIPYTGVSASGLDSYLITMEAYGGNTVILQMKQYIKKSLPERILQTDLSSGLQICA